MLNNVAVTPNEMTTEIVYIQNGALDIYSEGPGSHIHRREHEMSGDIFVCPLNSREAQTEDILEIRKVDPVMFATLALTEAPLGMSLHKSVHEMGKVEL